MNPIYQSKVPPGKDVLYFAEDQLLLYLLNDEPEGYKYLYGHYSVQLFAIIKRIVHQREAARDVLQETFVKIWQNLKTYNAALGSLYTWMACIARNLAFDCLRSKDFKKNKTLFLINDVDDSLMSVYSQIADSGLKKLLTRLPKKNATLIQLFFFEGYTHTQISKIMLLPVGTVKSRIRLTMGMLRDLIKLQ